jgi:hypothetical protein
MYLSFKNDDRNIYQRPYHINDNEVYQVFSHGFRIVKPPIDVISADDEKNRYGNPRKTKGYSVTEKIILPK